MIRRILASGAVMMGLWTAACAPDTSNSPAAKVDAARLSSAATDGDNWMSYGRTYDEQRFSPLDQINTGNVGQLGLAWVHEFETDRGHEATPIMVDGVIYTTTSWSKVAALDAKTGKLLWSYDPKVRGETAHKACCDVVNRGVAVWGGKVFVGALDGRLIALDARNGKEIWSKVTVDQGQAYTITGAPRVVKGKVLIGNGGAEYGVRGYISAYDADSGDMVWRFYTTPNPKGEPDGQVSDALLKTKAAPTWGEGAWRQSGGGGTVWDAMAYDPELDLLYFGVGNGSPWNHQIRSGGKGDNLFVSSIVAVRPDTGSYVWHYQTTPGDSWDFTATQHLMLAELPMGGKTRKVIMQVPKNGFFYVLDRATGELLSANPLFPMPKEADLAPGMPVPWAHSVDLKTGRPNENPSARFAKAPALVFPAPFGVHNWHPMAMNPKENLVYVPAMLVPAATGNQAEPYRQIAGAWNTGTNMGLAALPDDEAQRKAIRAMLTGMLVAWDPVAGKPRWTVPRKFPWNSGILATAGGLVFQGTSEGFLEAFNAADGTKVWSYETQNGIIAPPMTYKIDGEQYVAVMVGYGGAIIAAPLAAPDRPVSLKGRLMVFKIGGTAKATPYVIPEKVALDLSTTLAPGNPQAGFNHFMRHCQVCHGASATGGLLPDLRYSPAIQDAGTWKQIVFDGANASRGMVSFSSWLNPAEIEDIRAYVVQQAKVHYRQLGTGPAAKDGAKTGN
ncbi:quinohemoprotein alcohol dehydrogenase ADH IIB [Candidatus Phycosocius bacilliformis]|uniref:Quinohemoprotein alcohol dehydrogenase ADH IIB n=1 Tax=Candidatus Phycosocius bacilliformis TaxID=1445552 RepID=A0A2P2ECF3_9PROT|nr:PQQ-dependent dehydrogenase, methanol/ethanol family [Candidatus Phycosocius bacilliformis]GBF58733.1 quinohemoprotein alcohol dehydrogenase ADH IIB [Candidatus Phycosocius bacilliformis]